MSGRGMKFIQTWLDANAQPGGNPVKLAAEALMAAQADGITRDDIEDETGPLATWIAESLQDIVSDLDY